jgi:hypothetical protein
MYPKIYPVDISLSMDWFNSLYYAVIRGATDHKTGWIYSYQPPDCCGWFVPQNSFDNIDDAETT